MVSSLSLQQPCQNRRRFLPDREHLAEFLLRLFETDLLLFSGFAQLCQLRLQFLRRGLRFDGLLQCVRFRAGFTETALAAPSALIICAGWRVVGVRPGTADPAETKSSRSTSEPSGRR